MEKAITLDPRWFQAGFQLLFLTYGCLALHWPVSMVHCAITVAGCILFQYVFESLRQKQRIPLSGPRGFSCWGFSVLISALGLCLLLRCNLWTTSLFAAFCTVASKFVLRINGRHFINPSAFGIVTALLFTNDAWLSPAQWGSSTVLFFAIFTLGTIVVTRVQKLDVSLAFLAGFAGLMAWRQLWVLGWPADHFAHTLATGSLLLFTFFMISDPRTAPAHPVLRIVWGFAVGAIAFYLSAFKWMYHTPIFVVVALAPIVPLLDRLFPARSFQWQAASLPGYAFLKRVLHYTPFRKMAAAALLILLSAEQAAAFCGFYVSKADGTLKNKTSQVILARDGDHTVITMYNDFKGDFREFAMVVPVPVLLKEKDIRVVDPQIFQTLNDYSGPRLVEYHEENPCEMRVEEKMMLMDMVPQAASDARQKGVRIEARYLVGEYDILILSAKQSGGLYDWLRSNGYRIPTGAREVLEPYVKSNLKFFVVKVNEGELKKLKNNFLRPIQIEFNSPKFMLPIRLGMANADGDQDLVVYAFSKQGRVECTNYRTVEMPTGQQVPLFVQKDFNRFYGNTFAHTWQKEGRAVGLVEYAWDVSPRNYTKCDPCTGTAPAAQDLVQAGVWWMQPFPDGADVFFTRLHFRYNRHDFPQDLVFQTTPNRASFQARYVTTHSARVGRDCPEQRNYLRQVRARKKRELQNLEQLTGLPYSSWSALDEGEEGLPRTLAYAAVNSDRNSGTRAAVQWWWTGIGVAVIFTALGFRRGGHV
ncbi:MAG: DUF2330 domain-containing protein [Chitinophagaceae bacterium]|nr:MAG: DUF2330 domain-containing protein [Chitinophagaceae bacterium]